MDFQPFEHAAWLAHAWQDGAPEHDLGASALQGIDWSEHLGGSGGFDASDWTSLHLGADAPLRDALAARWDLPTASLRVTAGTTGANTSLLMALLRPGCNVVCERPYYAPLPHLAAGLGAEVRFVDRDPDQDWRLDPAAVADRADDDTVAVVLTSPNNPTGAATSAADLEVLGDTADAVGAHVLVDQVYRELTDHPVAARVHPACITTAGFNKTWGAAGLRTGWMAGDPDVLERAFEAHRLAIMSPAAAGVRLGRVLLEHEDAARAALRTRLEATHAVHDGWCRREGRAERALPGALTVLAAVADDAAAQTALDAGLLVVPGATFGAPGHVRVGLGIDPDRLRTGLDVLLEIDASLRAQTF